MFWRKYFVQKDERALLFYRGDFKQVLGPGEHVVFDPFKRYQLERYALEKTRFEHAMENYLLTEEREAVEREFHVVELGASEIGLRYENRVLVEVLASNTRRLYWKGYIEFGFERVDIAEKFAVDNRVAMLLAASAVRGVQKVTGADGVLIVQVPEHNVGVLYVDGKLNTLLEPGMHYFWKFLRDIKVEYVDLRQQAVEVAGQEILTRDKVPLRVNLTAGYRISDVLVAFAKQAKPVDYLYKELQFALRSAVGTRTLDELLENKVAIDEAVAATIHRRLAGFGLEVDSVGVKDIILPGDMKTILGKVVEAQKLAEANVIRRREETAATRSLLNTARVMEDNPTALRLKELETLEKVTEKIDKISVFGGLDGVLKDLVKIRA